jgi:hypothetical protein
MIKTVSTCVNVIIKKDYIAEMNKNELISIPGQCQDQTYGGN